MIGSADGAPPAAAGPRATRTVRLRPFRHSDEDWVYELMCGPSGETFRYRGRTPAPDVVMSDLWRGVAVQLVVERVGDGRRCGLVGLCNTSFESARSQAFAIAEPGLAPVVSEGFGILCEWAFEHFGLQRIHLELPEFNAGYVASLGAAAVVEGRLRNYELWRGRWWDLLIVVLTPESFHERVGALLRSRRSAPEVVDLRVVDDLPPDHLTRLVEELWPVDSLGAVELLDALEHELGVALPAELLLGAGLHDDVDGAEPADAHAVTRRIWRRALSSRSDAAAEPPRPSMLPS